MMSVRVLRANSGVMVGPILHKRHPDRSRVFVKKSGEKLYLYMYSFLEW